MRKDRLAPLFGLALLLLIPPAEAPAAEDRFRRGSGDRIYGEELMRAEERQEYRQQMWNLRTEADREHFRDRHRQKMQERAWDTGTSLPREELGEERNGKVEKRWPEDGLRRWPENRGQTENGLRRWQASPAGTGTEEEGNEKEPTRGDRGEPGWRSPGPAQSEPLAKKTGRQSADRRKERDPALFSPDTVRPGVGAVGYQEPPPEPGKGATGLRTIRRPAVPGTR